MHELEDRVAAAYNARTYAELEPLTRDLPGPGTGDVVSAGTQADPLPAIRTSRFAIAFMGAFHRRGTWAVARRFSALSLMGGGVIDLRGAQLTDGRVAITAFAIMGGIEIAVPEDAHVDAHGIGIMGAVSHGVRGTGKPGGPVITVRAFALMGAVTVRRRKSRNRQVDDGQADTPAAIPDRPTEETGQPGP